ncbi:hypothetical protein K469DRAFT_749732 [Zopfia rhizophila CBS 207.26]|uniref:Uncharacterized protein n=1 Tax=Zopfia rhizophila CBS 207.26 TaxID=1314779 RepID=A0A6A6E7F5_9PEZI|nr:hypothetical protein K469DRAFT_749732 [Zopfia rhizophila CBS 207.26]
MASSALVDLEEDLMSFGSVNGPSHPAPSRPAYPPPSQRLLDEDLGERVGSLPSAAPRPARQSSSNLLLHPNISVTMSSAQPKAAGQDSFASALNALKTRDWSSATNGNGGDYLQHIRVCQTLTSRLFLVPNSHTNGFDEPRKESASPVLGHAVSVKYYLNTTKAASQLATQRSAEPTQPLFGDLSRPTCNTASCNSPSLQSTNYDGDVRKLDTLLTHIQAQMSDVDEGNEEAPAAAQLPPSFQEKKISPPPGLGHRRDRSAMDEMFRTPSPCSVRILTNEDAQESIVRLTLPVYESMIQNMEKLKTDARLAEARHHLGITDVRSVQQDQFNNSSRISQLEDQPGKSGKMVEAKLCNDRLMADVAHLAAEKAELQTASKSKCAQIDYRSHGNDVLPEGVGKLKDEKLRDVKLELERLREEKLQADRENRRLIQALTIERDTLLTQQPAPRNRSLASAFFQKDQEIRDLNAKLAIAEEKEKENNELRAKVQTEKNEGDVLTQQLKQASKSPSEIAELEAKVKEKESEASRLLNDKQNLQKQLENKEALCRKLENDRKVLRGAAHLVQPAQGSRLPKTVFQCVECYVKNLQCDNAARCRNCVDESARALLGDPLSAQAQ